MKKNWIEHLDLSTLLRLRRGLRGSEGMIMEREIYDQLGDSLWQRQGEAIDEWPVEEAPGDVQLVRFCSKAESPDDPRHRPAQRLSLSAEEPTGTLGGILSTVDRVYYACSCGQRDDDNSFNKIDSLRRKAHTRWWWPTKRIDGVQHLLVCPHAPFADSLDHAVFYLSAFTKPQEYRCICRHAFVLDDTNHRLPVARCLPAH